MSEEKKTVIWKYPLKTGENILTIPKGFGLLKAGAQTDTRTDGQLDQIVVWAHVDPTEEHIPVTIQVIGTGVPFDDSNRYWVDTVQMGPYVYHIFCDFED